MNKFVGRKVDKKVNTCFPLEYMVGG